MVAVEDFVSDTYGIDKSCMVRPFWPGADYTDVDYSGKVVVDNPPFSIMSQILDFYTRNDIKFFLFANANTLFGLRRRFDLAFFPVDADVVYENGAKIRTAFVSNLEPGCVWTCIRLRDAVCAASDEYTKSQRVTLPKYKMPDNVWNAATLMVIASHGVEVKIQSEEYELISAMDQQRAEKKSIFGGGLLFSDGAAELLDEALRKADEARQITWSLSYSEREMIEKLNNNVSRET